MKNFLIIILFTFSSVLFANDSFDLKYKSSNKVKIAGTLLVGGLLSVTAGELSRRYGKLPFKVNLGEVDNVMLLKAIMDFNKAHMLGHMTILAGAFVAEFGLLTISLSDENDFHSIDKKDTLRLYKEMKMLLTYYGRTDFVPTSKRFPKILRSYTCDGCESDEDKARHLGHLFKSIDEVAYELVLQKKIKFKSTQDAVDYTNSKKSLAKQKSLIKDNSNSYNLKLINYLLTLSVVNEYVKQNN